jgi:FAD-dependent urate hydroxylase
MTRAEERAMIEKAIVIGGGIAGPVAAMALHRAGIEATVHEAYSGDADGVGAQLGIAPNGLHALDVLGLGDIVRSGTPVSAMAMESWTGKRLATFGEPGGEPILHVLWRGELNRGLADEAARRGIRIEYGKRFADAEDGPDGVTAHFADGSSATADILIGADGIESAVRAVIDPASPGPRYTGLLGLAGLVPDARIGSDHGVFHMSYGRRAFFAHLGLENGDVGWFVNLPQREAPGGRPMTMAEAQAVDPGEWLRILREVCAADRTPAPRILARMRPEDLVVIGSMHILPAVPVWSRGRIVLVGDASAVPSNSSGQGASQAIEGAVQLARCLRDLPYPEAFRVYEQIRRPRVERIIKMAQRTNDDKAAGPVARVLRDLVMPFAMKAVAKPSRMAWQNEYRIDWDAPVALASS